MTRPLPPLRAILFDKDGTLFDFAASWSGWAHSFLDELSAGDSDLHAAMAAQLHFDTQSGRFLPTSSVIAGTLDEQMDLLLPLLPDWSRTDLRAFLHRTASDAQMIAPVPLAPLLTGLAARGLTLGVATNDGEGPARQHLTRAGILGHFAEVLGYDSGYTPKPAPDMLLGFAERVGIDPAQIAMVGDSLHDLHAGRAAGMVTVGVLTGLADHDTLAPMADIVLPDIGHLPGVV